LALECKRDPHPDKIDLTIGAYRDDTGKPMVLACVRDAEATVFGAKNTDHTKINDNLGLPDDPSTEALFKFVGVVLKK
jgi:aspartate aminotransferase